MTDEATVARTDRPDGSSEPAAVQPLSLALESLQDERRQLESTRADVKAALRDTQQSMREAEIRVRQITAKTSPLERLIKDLETARSAIAGARQAAERDQAGAQAWLDEVRGGLQTIVPKPRRDAIDKAVQRVKDDIGKEQETVETLRQESSAADTALAQARQATAVSEARWRDAVIALRELPGEIQRVRSRVAAIIAAARAGAARADHHETFYLAGELEEALGSLAALASAKTETDRIRRVADDWLEASEGTTAVVATTAALHEARSKLAAAEAQLRRKMQSREADIRRSLPRDSRESPEPAGTPEPADRRASSPATRKRAPARKA